MPHVDPHITVIAPLDGIKLWPILASPDPDAANFFDATAKADQGNAVDFNEFPWIPVVLEPGSVLIMPVGMAHSPFSPQDVVCTGSAHIDSREILASLRLANQVLENDSMTNDEPEPCYAALVAIRVMGSDN